MALVRCPRCRQITGDFPDVEATLPDGTALDSWLCLDCMDEDGEAA